MYILKFSFPFVGPSHRPVCPHSHLSPLGMPSIFYTNIYPAITTYFFSVFCPIKLKRKKFVINNTDITLFFKLCTVNSFTLSAQSSFMGRECFCARNDSINK